jgi:hypothetical protein
VTETTELAVVEVEGEFKDIRPVVTPDEARAAMAAYQAIAEAVTEEEDYQTFTSRDKKTGKTSLHKFRKRGGWKKLERFFFVSVEIREERIFHAHVPAICLRVKMPEAYRDVVDCGCPIKGVRYWIRATDTRSGRYNEDLGICIAGEPRVPVNASLHDLATRAYNRGANRSTAGLLGVSDPSAEERQAEGGLSKEERMTLKGAWDDAAAEARTKALTFMGEVAGVPAADMAPKDIYVAFLRRADAEQVEAAVQVLSEEAEEKFDPDEVPDA